MFSRKKMANLFALLVIGSLVLSACATPTPQVIEKVVTQVVEKTVKETVIVEGTPQVVEKVVTEIVKEEVVVTATPEPTPPPPPRVDLEGLWYPLGTEPPTLDIQLATDTTSHLIIRQCIEGLFEYRGDGSIEPTGATGFEVSGDGLVYTIHLREDAVWSDGVPVVAQHFVDGVLRLLDPETEAGYPWLMYDVEGAEGQVAGGLEQHGVEERDVDVLPLPGAVAMAEGRQGGE